MSINKNNTSLLGNQARLVNLEGLRVGLVSLGCPKNLVDSEVMLGLLEKAGCQLTVNEAEAEVLIVNTCGFIGPAQQEAVNTILDLGQYKTNGHCRALIVTGCLVQRFAKELAVELPEVDALVGTGEFNQIASVIQKVLRGEKVQVVGQPLFLYNENWPRKLSTPGHYAYVKVAEGCDNCCTYCTIPEIRGRFRSRSIPSIFQEAEDLVKAGVKEIILIAQDTTRYGEDLYGTPKLAELLRELTKISDLTWIRWMYGYPTRISSELINTMAENPKICPYIDLPLQHIDSDVLIRMNRPANLEELRRIISQMRNKLPDLALRTSFIVGFPGETEEAFMGLLEFLKEIRFDRVGAFTYSPEEGTEAAGLSGAVAEEIKSDRYRRLMECQQQISLENNQKWVGRSLEVMVEGIEEISDFQGKNGFELLGYGRSIREAPEIDGLVYILDPLRSNITIGEMVKVTIIRADHYDLIGVVNREFAQ
jgi:ribosomal protein S12 methylthiotransferase